jgi:choline dehydrogenase-like flavoprotein
MSQVIRSPKMYDVCVIGSGAGGGTAAKILTEGGLSVALLEAGPPVYPEKDFRMLTWPYELPHRGAGVGGHASENFSEFLAPNGAWNIDGEPYTSAPGANFQWFRSRIVGGRTNHWGRIALRFAPIDFRSATRDGLGDDWPITYDDLAPYYDKVESYKTALHGSHRQKSLRQDRNYLHSLAAGYPDPLREWQAALPLLRPMRPRVCYGIELQFKPGDDSTGDENRKTYDDHRRDGARSPSRQGR